MPVAARTGRGSIALRGAPTVVASATVTDEQAPDEAGPGGTSGGGRGGRSGRRRKGRRRGRRGGGEGNGGAGVCGPRRPRPGGDTDAVEVEPEEQIGPTTRSKAEDASRSLSVGY
jgi:hypothetical protein